MDGHVGKAKIQERKTSYPSTLKAISVLQTERHSRGQGRPRVIARQGAKCGIRSSPLNGPHNEYAV